MKLTYVFIFLILPCIFALPTPDSTTDSLVIASKQAVNSDTDTDSEEVNNASLPPQLKSMNVTSHIRNRYARTVVTSKYTNPQSKAQEAIFAIMLPNTAFITGFVMEIKGQEYKAYVREKEEAKREYEAAVRAGQSAAHVAVSARDSNRFTVSMNVEPHSKVTFTLTYEQLLVRKHGRYELVVNLNPGQFIKQLTVDAYINETRRILSVNTPALRSGNEIQQTHKTTKNEFSTVETLNIEGTNVHVNFSPSKEQQQQMAAELNSQDDAKGLTGQFTVVYDVERDPQGGDVLISDGYFVHFFAPSDLTPLSKHVVFVLDVSGSMSGRKLNQLKQAMKVILAELSDGDFFDIIKFSSTVQVLNTNNTWDEIESPSSYDRPSTHSATPEKIAAAQDVIKNLRHEGWTNIYDALQVAVKISNKNAPRVISVNDPTNLQPMIIFLTDGQANVGESRSEKIIKMVTSRNMNAAVFTLGFGRDVDKDLLKGLAIKNHGFMRPIYEAADAALQLQDFYKEISSPLLTDVKFQYTDEQLASVTTPNFPIMFRGSELVVAGKIKTTTDDMITVEGKTRTGPHTFRPHVYPLFPPSNKTEVYGNLERLWAYLSIKQLLDKKYETEPVISGTETESPEKLALKLALQYSFVTPVTSLVVVKPNVSEAVEAEEALPIQTRGYGLFVRRGSARHAVSASSSSAFDLRSGSSPSSTAYESRALNFSPAVHRPKLFAIAVDRVYQRTSPNKTIVEYLPWLAPYYSNDQITIDSKVYMVGNNQTSVEEKQCNVESLGYTGNCRLLSACPMIYPNLNSFDTYKKYFCILSDTYAGVCCVATPNT